jgi:hypothetical protein
MEKIVASDLTRWRNDKDQKRSELMTNEDMVMVNDFLTLLNHNAGTMATTYAKWQEIEEAYKSDQPEEEDIPNSRINVVLPTVEGMVSQLTDNNISIITKGQGPEDSEFAEDARIGLDWVLRHNQLRAKIAMHERRRIKFGGCWFKVCYDKYAINGYGLAKVMLPAPTKIWVDTKIKDFLRLDEADYICEVITSSKFYAKRVYGSKANAIDYGYSQYFQNNFEEEFTVDDQNSWSLIQWWMRIDGVLRLLEFSGCGVLLFDSFRSKDRKILIKDIEEKEEPMYRYVHNDYPYFYTPKYPSEGELTGFGDGKIMIPLQKMFNELYDKIRIQMRPNIVCIDSRSGINPEVFDDNSFEPIHFKGGSLNGAAPMFSIPWGQINPDMYRLVDMIHIVLQRVVRYADAMLGQSQSATATEAAINQQQGNSHISFEKTNLEETLSRVAKYCLGLMMEFSNSGMTVRVNEQDEEYSWVDFRKLREIPVQIPASSEYKKQFREANPEAKEPSFELLEQTNPKTGKKEIVTKDIELDIEISVGSSLPKNPAFLWNMIEKLSQLLVVDNSENPPVPKPAIDWKELRSFMKDFLGIPIKTDNQMKEFVEMFKKMQMQNIQNSMNTQGQFDPGQTANPNVQGMTAAGNVQPAAAGGGTQGTPPMGQGQGAY